ncbi:AAA family ATPase [Streptomyces montanisoli]|uniref:AAA family ATPase n=1 Tax=Streptomyces montanisoli TaxID=2798581 RepID=A0A940MFH6_9ACTN|nr:AAA family ATPase [Streptomyces montanisoli]MBP0459050.1 AAA family ATPase [Streptomyces montanisoli]
MVAGPGLPRGLPLLEREPELAAAARAVRALCAGTAAGAAADADGRADPGTRAVPTGGVLVYRGAAGLGKTALLAEVRAIAGERCVVWSARCGEALSSVPFHVARQLLQPALTAGPGELLGDWYETAGPALGVAPPGAQYGDPHRVREGLDALTHGLTDAYGPLVLLVDDAQWADLETLAWLASFARAPGPGLPVLLVVAYRTEDATGAAAELLATVGASARLVVTLKPLTADATARLARTALGPRADAAFCHEVWAVTGGNAYEAVELLARARDSGMDPVGASAAALRGLGASTRGAGLVRRLAELGTPTIQFARAAAVLGTRIPLATAMAVAGMGGAEAAGCAERLRAARILVGTDPLEFVHPLIASAVYRAIPPATRTALHGRAAWVITRGGGGAAAAAPHLLEVHPDGDHELVRQLREAAAEHLAVGAPDAARRCLRRALAEPPPSAERSAVLYELGCATLLTAPATTVGHLRDALEGPGLAGGDRVAAVLKLAQVLAHTDRGAEAAGMVAAEAELCPPGPLRDRYTAVRYLWEGLQAAEAHGPLRSRRLADATEHLTGEGNTERVLLTLRAFDAAVRGESAAPAVRIAERALVGGGPAPGLRWTDTEWGFEVPALLGLVYVLTDRLDRAEALFTEALRDFELSGWSGGHLAFAHTMMGLTHRRRGRLAEAEGYLREGVRLADGVGDLLPVRAQAVCVLVDTLLARGHVGRAAACAERYGFGPPYPTTMLLPDGACVHGRLLLALGRTEQAVDELESAGRALTGRGRHNIIAAPWALDLARALAGTDPARAAELAGYVQHEAARLGTRTAMGEALACAASLRHGRERADLLERAVAHLEASPSGYELARARVEYGIAAGFTAEIALGHDLAAGCGADGLAARASRALESARLRH